MIKNVLWEYYHPTEKEISRAKKTATYVFDACSLLEIYRLPPQKRKNLFKIFDKLSKKSQLWLPHQFAREYLKNRKTVLKQEIGKYDETIKQFDGLIQVLEQTVKKYNFNIGNHLAINIDTLTGKIIKSIKSSADKCVEGVGKSKSKHPDWSKVSKDLVHNKINQSFKVGSGYATEELIKIKKKIKDRFDNNIQPGLTDKGKGINDDGDVMAWLQMLDYAHESKKPVILITEETKKDWYEKYTNGQLTMPARSLVREMHEYCKQVLYIMNLSQFMGDNEVQSTEPSNNIDTASIGTLIIGSESVEPLTNDPVIVSK